MSTYSMTVRQWKQAEANQRSQGEEMQGLMYLDIIASLLDWLHRRVYGC